MPSTGTPSVRGDVVVNEIDASSLPHSFCPPEDDRNDSWMQEQIRINAERVESDVSASSHPTPPPSSSQQPSTPEDSPVPLPHTKMDVEIESKPGGMISPISMGSKSNPESEKGAARVRTRTLTRTPTNPQPMPIPMEKYASSSSSMDYEFSNVRLLQSSPSSFLRPGSKFTGTQKSDKMQYTVNVEVKQVDLRESYMCGFLEIKGLTEDHPSLTTFFEGEIIGSKYTFLTKHPDWGASRKSDLDHWELFDSWKKHYKVPMINTGKITVSDPGQQKIIFMRWKEHFLVPDHRVRTITGASFEGFYYIAFDQVSGAIEGTYFHAKSEKFQKLELTHVPDRGAFAAIEMR